MLESILEEKKSLFLQIAYKTGSRDVMVNFLFYYQASFKQIASRCHCSLSIAFQRHESFLGQVGQNHLQHNTRKEKTITHFVVCCALTYSLSPSSGRQTTSTSKNCQHGMFKMFLIIRNQLMISLGNGLVSYQSKCFGF